MNESDQDLVFPTNEGERACLLNFPRSRNGAAHVETNLDR
jgi:hypothetical protein